MHHSRVYATFQKTVTLTRCSLTFENQNQKKLTINLTITTTTTTATKSTTITTLIKHRTNQTWHTLLKSILAYHVHCCVHHMRDFVHLQMCVVQMCFQFQLPQLLQRALQLLLGHL